MASKQLRRRVSPKQAHTFNTNTIYMFFYIALLLCVHCPKNGGFGGLFLNINAFSSVELNIMHHNTKGQQQHTSLFTSRGRTQSHVTRHETTSPTTIPLVGVDEFLSFLSEENKDRITVIRFHADWCKACQRLDARYRKLVMTVGDNMGESVNDDDDADAGLVRSSRKSVRFADVDYGNSANTALCQYMDVTKLPCFHIYRKSADNDNTGTMMPKRLCALVCEPKMFNSLLVDRLNHYLALDDNDGDCSEVRP